MKAKKIVSIILMFVSTAIMSCPNSIPVLFSSNEGGSVIIHYSYYRLLLLGYGNWLPMIIAVMSFFVVLFLLATLKYDVRKITMVLMGLILIATFFSWLTFKTYSPTTLTVFGLHIATFLLQFDFCRRFFRRDSTDV